MANSTTEFNMNKTGVKSFTITPLNSFFKSPNQGGTMSGLSQQQPFGAQSFVATTQKPIVPSFFTPAQTKPIATSQSFGFGQTQKATPIVNPTSFGFGQTQVSQPTPTPIVNPFSFCQKPRSIYPQTQFVPTNTDTILQQAYMPISESDVIYNKEELKNFLYTETYNKESVAQKDNDIYIRLNSAILRFEVSDKLGEDTYKLKDKIHQIELAITFGTTKPYFSQHELNYLKIRPIGKKLFNKDKNRLENCYFIESYDGTLYKYLSELKRVEGRERSFGSLNTDIPRILHIVEQVRKQMISLYEMNNRYAYTDLQFDNIAYKYRTYEGNNVDDVEFRLLVDQLPYDSDNIYLSTYPPIDLKKGEMILSSNEDRLHAMSWQLGILLISFVARHTMQFNKLNWVVNNSFTQSDYTELLNIMRNSYGDKIVKYLHNVPSERPSIFEPIV